MDLSLVFCFQSLVARLVIVIEFILFYDVVTVIFVPRSSIIICNGQKI